jgi:hypothetical protein
MVTATMVNDELSCCSRRGPCLCIKRMDGWIGEEGVGRQRERRRISRSERRIAGAGRKRGSMAIETVDVPG